MFSSITLFTITLNLLLRPFVRIPVYLIIGLKSKTEGSVLDPLDNVACPLESCPAQSIKVSECKRSVADVVV